MFWKMPLPVEESACLTFRLTFTREKPSGAFCLVQRFSGGRHTQGIQLSRIKKNDFFHQHKILALSIWFTDHFA